jgi:NTE family protein
MNGNPKRALVLSGGGGRGAYECGVYKYLEEIGWEPDILVGTSIGAINAAAIASGRSAAELEAAWLKTHTKDIQRFWRLRPWKSIYDTSPWRRTLHRYIDFDALPATDKRLLIAATELETLTPDHILASCSIPLVYPWTQIEDCHYWDGAVMANTPLAGAIDAGADEVVIVLLSPIGERHMEPPRWPWHALTVVLDLALSATYENDLKQLENVNQLVAAQVDSKHRHIKCQVITPSKETDLLRIIRYEPDFSADLIQMGYEDAREELEAA